MVLSLYVLDLDIWSLWVLGEGARMIAKIFSSFVWPDSTIWLLWPFSSLGWTSTFLPIMYGRVVAFLPITCVFSTLQTWALIICRGELTSNFQVILTKQFCPGSKGGVTVHPWSCFMSFTVMRSVLWGVFGSSGTLKLLEEFLKYWCPGLTRKHSEAFEFKSWSGWLWHMARFETKCPWAQII